MSHDEKTALFGKLMHCKVCGKSLTGGLDTYGAPGEEVCFDDHFNPPGEPFDVLHLAELEDEWEGHFDRVTELEDDLEEALDADDAQWAAEARAELEYEREQLEDAQEQIVHYRRYQRQRDVDKLTRWSRLVIPLQEAS